MQFNFQIVFDREKLIFKFQELYKIRKFQISYLNNAMQHCRPLVILWNKSVV